MGILKNCKISDKTTSDTGSCKLIHANTTVEDIPSIFQADPNGNECRSYYYQFLYSKGYLVDDEKTKEQYIEAYDEFLNMPVAEAIDHKDIDIKLDELPEATPAEANPAEVTPVEEVPVKLTPVEEPSLEEVRGGKRTRRRRRRSRRHRKKSRRHRRSLRRP